MKTRRRIQTFSALLIFCLLFGSLPPLFSADTARPLAIPTAKTALPQPLLDAIALCERDRAAIVTAQTTLDAAAAAKARAVIDSQNDYKALLALIASIYNTDPVPPGPLPPDPPSPPDPPVPPVPPVPPAPVVGPIRVLFLYESGDLTKLAPAQVAILTSLKVRSYLKAHCPLESDCATGACPLTAASTPSYRFFDKDIDLSKMPKQWQDSMAYLKPKLPSPFVPTLLICDANGPVFDGPWPANETATIELLTKWGGK